MHIEKLEKLNNRLVRSCLIILCLFFLSTCTEEKKTFTILGNVEDPQNQIALTITSVLNKHLADSMKVVSGLGSLANLDSLESAKADFGIVDNYSRFSDKVSAVLPLYPQLLHIFHKKNQSPKSLHELFTSGKIFAGVEGSGTKRFVDDLMEDLGIEPANCTFVDVYDFFEADVIFAFTDLLTREELRDLKDYKLYSIDAVSDLGKGTLAEGICTRHPQFEPYVIARDLYGDFTDTAILTIKVDAILVCRADLDPNYVYSAIQVLSENREDLKNINPLLYRFASEFDAHKLSFALHPGSRDYLDRHAPTFAERYAELVGVIITLIVALGSMLYSLRQWQSQKKKNKIDVYYQKLILIRKKSQEASSIAALLEVKADLQDTQERAIDLVTKEKLLADDSFVIFLNLSKIVTDEIDKKQLLLSQSIKELQI